MKQTAELIHKTSHSSYSTNSMTPREYRSHTTLSARCGKP